MNNLARNILVILVILVGVIFMSNMLEGVNHRNSSELAYSELLREVEQSNIREVTIEGRRITGIKSDDSDFTSYAPEDNNLVTRLEEKGVKITAKPVESGKGGLLSVLISWFPMLLLIGVWIFFMRQMNGSGGKAMGFGKSKAKLLTEHSGRVTFENVAGIEEAKQELTEVVDFLKSPQKYQRLGGKIPKGVLLVGPPGTGKTLTARAVAGEANVPFFTISGSDFVEMFVGVGASRVRDMFEQGKRNAPCIIFIDEIDAVGRHRGAGLGGGNDEREQTLNQLLVEMDGFEASEGVILIAATNRPDVLDPALLRPGRFDRQVTVPNPDIKGREQILKVHMKNVPISHDVDARVIARGTPGFSGADLANLVNEAALMAARGNKNVVAMEEFEAARDKVMMGAERKSMVMSDREKEMTAYHEVGHALVGLFMPAHDPLHKVTIIPRGRALGVTMSLPERDKLSQTYEELVSRLASLYGGRMAEELIYGKDQITTGAGHDIQQATNLARAMVTQFGFSDELGRVKYEGNEQEVFLGHSVAQSKNVSEKTSQLIDTEVRRFIQEAEDNARRILTENMEILHKVSKALVEYETLSGAEVRRLIEGKEIRTSQDDVDFQPDSMQAQKLKRSSVPAANKKVDLIIDDDVDTSSDEAAEKQDPTELEKKD